MSLCGHTLKRFLRYPSLLSRVQQEAFSDPTRYRHCVVFSVVRWMHFEQVRESPWRPDTKVSISTDKTECLFDEDINVKVTGVSPKDKVTVVATTQQDELLYWSHGLFSANEEGVVDLSKDSPLAGSYDDADSSGLLWSMTPAPWLPKGTRLFQPKAVKPRIYKFAVFPQSDRPTDFLTDNSPLIDSIEHKRWYKGENVRRIPIDHPRIKGTMFLPGEGGTGPFPGVIDMYGGFIRIMEGRAALLASHGFASLALSYVHGEGLPQKLNDIELSYFEEAAAWFSRLPDVRSDGLGILGLCLGGTMGLWMTQNIQNIKAVVNVNGLPHTSPPWTYHGRVIGHNAGYDLNKIVYTDEGVILKYLLTSHEQKESFLKPWTHGAHLLTLLSGDDLTVNMKHNVRLYEELMPSVYRQEKAELVIYPGAGHLLEAPNTPHCRVIAGAQQALHAMGLRSQTYNDNDLVLMGGFPKEHAVAQKHAWHKVLHFLKRHLT